MNINNVVVAGRLTRDLELKKTQNNISVVSFTLAISRQYDRENTDFVDCVAWKHNADFITKYGKKGDIVSVSGRLQTGGYEKDGQNFKKVEIIADRLDLVSSSKAQTTVSSDNAEETATTQTDEDVPF